MWVRSAKKLNTSRRKERAPVGESSNKKAAGKGLAFPMQGVGRSEGLQVGAAEMQVTEETVPVEADEVQVAGGGAGSREAGAGNCRSTNWTKWSRKAGSRIWPGCGHTGKV